ncbi:ATPase, AAA+ type, core [Cordyceps fumosorosea ARSEF 2679]|uniref:ATPase, AAA+ type, core n=1 Tax=Cordyceps fumosorosea (strain ARSEF 2679) TaxID=1081104 RepID=A0A167WMQ0_CORFA|nr:ATPase, AAA+ type, core [Cordyceps fumosorosea ARSEF 2679]OAA63984.1 ATPase, AAA+ type, core [Cordyceps fumosorosea ARSEF 2679]
MCDYFLHDVYEHLDNRTRYKRCLDLCGEMMKFQLAAVGVLFVTSIAVGAVATRADAGSTGVALLFANQFSKVMSELLQRLVDVEGDMVSVSRVDEYADLPAERVDGEDLPEAWALQGELKVSGLTASPEMNFEQCLLQDVSFSVSPGGRVGIVGRTGAGKSSLTLALTRHLQMRGSITIDGVDLTSVNVKELRRRLLVISQDPYLFGATLREVVDPAGVHTDDEIRNVLTTVSFPIEQKSSEIKDVSSTAGVSTEQKSSEIQAVPSTAAASTKSKSSASTAIKLDFEVGHGGLKLSQGQRQMLRLAQVLLADRRMIIMDEATSALDADDDAAVQLALRYAEGGKAKLLVVAHRLATVADFDMLLVVENGRLEESGRPAELYQKGGLFTDLVNSSVDKDELLKKF